MARALRRHIADDSLGGSHAAGIGLQQTNEAAAEAKSGLAEVDRIQRRPPQVPDRSPAAKVAPDQDRPDLCRRAAGHRDQVGHGDAVLDLVDAGESHRSGDGDQRGSACPAAACFAVPGVAEARNECCVGQALDVLHQGRVAPNASLERTLERGGGPGVARVQVVDNRARLARYVAARRLHQPDRNRIAPAAFGDRAAHGAHRFSVLASNVDDKLVSADCRAGENPAVNHQVRSEMHERPILRAARLTLRAIRDDHGTAARPLGHAPPLAPHGESGSAAADQAAALDRGDDPREPGRSRQLAEARPVLVP